MFNWLRKSDKGFTLVELMMVIVILGVLAGVAVPLLGNMKAGALKAKANSLIDSTATSILMSYSLTDALPDDATELNGLLTLPNDFEYKVITDADAKPTWAAGGKKYCISYFGSGTSFQLKAWTNNGTDGYDEITGTLQTYNLE